MLRFLGIGAQKAGTTWLYQILRQHPEIGFPLGKEGHYWDQVTRARDAAALQGYLTRFSDAARVEGEITPAYAALDDDAIRLIQSAVPDLRLILMLRNPLERAWSAALMVMARLDMAPAETSDAWFLDQIRSRASLARGDYADTIERWCRRFGRDALLAPRFEGLATAPEDLVNDCLRHLGVAPLDPEVLRAMGTRRVVFAGTAQEPPRPALWAELQRLYTDRIARLEQILDQDLSDWLTPPAGMAANPSPARPACTSTRAPAVRPAEARPLDFIIAGPQGTGEQWLARQLARHPEVRMAVPPLAHQSGSAVTEALLDLALGRGEEAPTGSRDQAHGLEVLTGVVDHHFATLDAARITHLVRGAPGIRVVLLVRPAQGRLPMAAAAALKIAQLAPEEVSAAWLESWMGSAFQRRQGDDGGISALWQAQLGPGQLHRIRFEDLITAPTRTLEACCRFLGLSGGMCEADPYDLAAELALLEQVLPSRGAVRGLLAGGSDA